MFGLKQYEFPGSVKQCDKKNVGNLGFKATFWAFLGKMWHVTNPQGNALASISIPSSCCKNTLVDLQADVLFSLFIATWLCSTFPAAIHWNSYQWEKVGHPNAVLLGLSGTSFAVKFLASEKSLWCYPASFASTSGHLCATCSCSGLCCVILWPELQENICPSVYIVWCEQRCDFLYLERWGDLFSLYLCYEVSQLLPTQISQHGLIWTAVEYCWGTTWSFWYRLDLRGDGNTGRAQESHCDECKFQGKWGMGSRSSVLLQAYCGLSYDGSASGVQLSRS